MSKNTIATKNANKREKGATGKETAPAKAKKSGGLVSSAGTMGWTEEEDARLLVLVEKMSEDLSWPKLSRQMPGKTSANCQARWEEVLKKDSKKGNWTTEEDDLLKKWVSFAVISGEGTWSSGMDQLCAGDSGKEWEAVPRAVGEHLGSNCQDWRLGP